MVDSRVIIFGVVPEAIKEWNPETAPQAMVMHTKGNTGPAKTRPLPSMNLVIAGICNVGLISITAAASMATVPSFKNVLR
jgi:hypothetical protein